MRALVFLIVVITALSSGGAFARGVERLERMEAAPKGWAGPVFAPRLDYPGRPGFEVLPWMDANFRHEPERYLRVVLAYALEGQDKVDWKLQANTARRWYHVPWLGPGPGGREFIHGMTRARDFRPGELSAAQTRCRQNWAVAFYNEAGGATLARVWMPVVRGKGGPDLSALPFPIGTVAVKVVYTEATAEDDPRLTGAPELKANIHARSSESVDCPSAVDANGRAAARTPQTLRLMQIDLAVREVRASYKTGWVFGSFVYDGREPGADPWAKLKPVGLMWGNDPLLSDADAAAGVMPMQSVSLNGAGLGRGGRMNGPVDEPRSACSSCHMAAQWPTVAPMTASADWNNAKCWFRNLDARYPFGFAPTDKQTCGGVEALTKMRPLDFSLQLSIALRNWAMANSPNGGVRTTSLGKLKRDGDELTVNGFQTVPLKR